MKDYISQFFFLRQLFLHHHWQWHWNWHATQIQCDKPLQKEMHDRNTKLIKGEMFDRFFSTKKSQIWSNLKIFEITAIAPFFSWTLNFCVTSYGGVEMKKKWKSHQLIIAKEVWMVKEVEGSDGYFVRFRLCRCLSWFMTHECTSLIWNWTQLPFMHHRSLQKNIAVWSFSFWAKTLCRNTPSYQAALGNHWSGWSVLAFSRWTMEMKYINYIFYLYYIIL